MKILTLLLTFASFTLPVFAQSQAEMNAGAAAEFQKADKELNAVYKKVKAEQDEDGLVKLKTAQRAWLAYRDAEAELEAAPNEGGSIYPLVYANVQTRLTEARTKELQALLDGDVAEPEVPRDAHGNAYGEGYNPDGADDPNM